VIPGKRTPGRQPRDIVDWSYDLDALRPGRNRPSIAPASK
jgi:hypothetical protein